MKHIPRKQLLRKLGVFLLLGVVVNVAVAWTAVLACRPAARYISRTVIETQPFLMRSVDTQAFRGVRIAMEESLTLDQTNTRIETKNCDLFAGWPCDGLSWERRWQRRIPYEGGERTSLWLQPSESLRTGIELSWRKARGLPDPLLRLHRRPSAKPEAISAVPIIPLWPGFAINTIFYAAMLWLLWVGPGKIRRFVRIRGHRCPACGYIIAPGTAAASGAGGPCSECGACCRTG
jgi:hypothetical protein